MFEGFEGYEGYGWVVGNAGSAAAAMVQWQADLIAAISGTDSAVMQAVATEAARAVAAEADLQGQVSNLLVEGTIPAVQTERAERIAADGAEAGTRGADDVALGARIDAEEATRAQADTDEATARDAADELLDGRLDTIETAGYITQGPLTAEASARQAADALEATTRADADTSEIAARNGAISTHAGLKRGVHGIPATVSAGQAIVGDGSGGFSAVDVATQAEQDAAIASEVSSRNSAIGSAVAAHESDTTNVHGIADTSKVTLSNVAQTRTKALTITPDADGATALTLNATGNAGRLFSLNTPLLGGVIQHNSYLSGATGDLLDTINRGTGDNIWLVHMGGHPTSGDLAGTGGNAALNGLIPYHSDINPLAGTTGRDGTVVNTQQGMSLFRGESQATANTQPAFLLSHHGAGYAMYLANQINTSGQVQGGGGGFQIDDYSVTNALLIQKKVAAGAQKAAVLVKADAALSGSSATFSAFEVLDHNGATRGKWKTDGNLTLADWTSGSSSTTKVELRPIGTAAFGAGPVFGDSVKVSSVMDGTGVQRALALINRGASQAPANNDGASIEFDDGGNQYATITGKFDKVTASRDGSLRFGVNVGGTVTELLSLASSGGVASAAFASAVSTSVNMKVAVAAAGNTAYFTTVGGSNAYLVQGDGTTKWATSGTFDTSVDHPAANTLRFSASVTPGTNERFKLNATGIGFFGATPVAKPSAYTQTYATATKTHANPTAAAVATTAATNSTPYGFAQAQADAIVAAVNALVVDMANTKQVLNAVIDDQQALGLAA